MEFDIAETPYSSGLLCRPSEYAWSSDRYATDTTSIDDLRSEDRRSSTFWSSEDFGGDVRISSEGICLHGGDEKYCMNIV